MKTFVSAFALLAFLAANTLPSVVYAQPAPGATTPAPAPESAAPAPMATRRGEAADPQDYQAYGKEEDQDQTGEILDKQELCQETDPKLPRCAPDRRVG